MATATTPEAEAIIDSALKLSDAEREAIARRLLGSVRRTLTGHEPPEVFWAEIARRVEDVESGRVKALTPEEVFANVRQALEEARKT